MSWTEERVERLTKLWNDGLTASQIAKDLGEVTRNAVIGKVHRLGLSGRTKSTRTPVKRKQVEEAVAVPTAVGESMPLSSTTMRAPTAEQQSTSVQAKATTAPAPISSASSTTSSSFRPGTGGGFKTPAVVAPPRPPVQDEPFVPIHQRADILDLNENRCKWPIGDPTHDDFFFCGRQKDPAKSYCEHHCGVAYQNQDRRR